MTGNSGLTLVASLRLGFALAAGYGVAATWMAAAAMWLPLPRGQAVFAAALPAFMLWLMATSWLFITPRPRFDGVVAVMLSLPAIWLLTEN